MQERGISIIELEAHEIDDPARKNQYIRCADERYVLIVRSGLADSRELAEDLMRDDFLQKAGAAAFCGGKVEAVLSLPEILQSVSPSVSAIAFDREILKKSGCFHEKLPGLTDYEFLCRLAEGNGSCTILPAPERAGRMTEAEAFGYAYLLRRHLQTLHRTGALNAVVQRFSDEARRAGMFEVFQMHMNAFLASEQKYIEMAADTAPFVIIGGDETCGGVLQDFARRLGESLQGLGQAVIMLDEGFTDYERLRDEVFKGVVGFQARALSTDFFRDIRGKKIQFWFDYPVNFSERLMDSPEDYFFLCQDGNYAKFMKRYFHIGHALHFPPGGTDAGFGGNKERHYDIVFIGRYYPEQETELSPLGKEFYNYMLEHSDMTFEGGLEEVLAAGGVHLSDLDFAGKLRELSAVWHRVINCFRKRVIDTILAAGYDVNVYGETWKQYETPYRNRLKIHPEVSVSESLCEWGKARIGLNIMSWHKDGMTERIANIMLSGAVCVTDETNYIREHFESGKEIVTYRLSELEILPDILHEILQNESKREEIAAKGYEKALKEHTWECRAQQLLTLLGAGG